VERCGTNERGAWRYSASAAKYGVFDTQTHPDTHPAWRYSFHAAGFTLCIGWMGPIAFFTSAFSIMSYTALDAVTDMLVVSVCALDGADCLPHFVIHRYACCLCVAPSFHHAVQLDKEHEFRL
jgi:hypothetical protein